MLVTTTEMIKNTKFMLKCYRQWLKTSVPYDGQCNISTNRILFFALVNLFTSRKPTNMN